MRKYLTNAVLAISAALLAVPAYAQTSANPPAWWYGHHHDFGWGHMVFGSVMMLVFLVGLILLIFLAVRYFGHGAGGGDRSASGKTPLQILEARFARGEIDKAEFEERKRALSE